MAQNRRRSDKRSASDNTILPKPATWSEVFVSNGVPLHSFVDRPVYAKIVDSFLTHPGYKMLALSGLSRTGKTTLLVDRFNKKGIDALWIGGAGIETFEQFINNLREKLKLRSMQTEDSVNGEVELAPLVLLSWILGKLKFGASRKVTQNDDVEEIDILRELNNKVIVIDDFHRVPEQAQRKILPFIKFLCEQADRVREKGENIDFRFIFVFIPNTDTTAYSMWRELSGRVKPLELPLWQIDELLKITQSWLIDYDRVVLGLRKFASESYGLPAMMQLFCRTYCNQHLEHTKPEQIVSVRDDQLESVFKETGAEIWGPSGDSVYRELIALTGRTKPNGERKLTSKVDKRSGDIYQMIWYVLSLPEVPSTYREGLAEFQINTRLEITIAAITQRLERLVGFEAGQTDYVRQCIRFMSDETRISYPSRISRVDGESNGIKDARTHLNDPLFEYQSDNDSLVIYDPAILIGLGHAPMHRRKFNFAE